MRKILIIILIVLLTGAGVWYFYIRPKQLVGVSPVPNVLKAFFPTSTSNNTGAFGSDTSGAGGSTGGVAVGNTTTPIFKQLTGLPVAGYTIFDTSTTVSTPSVNPKLKPTVSVVIDHVIRYIGRGNGYVYEIKDAGIPLQISNIFIPNIYEGAFMDNNNTAVLRFLRPDDETIATYTLPIPPVNPDGTRTQKSGTYLPDNIANIAVSPDETQIIRVTSDNNGATISTSNSLGTAIKTLIRSPFVEWIPSWAGKVVYLQTKAAAIADGFIYQVNQTSARLQRAVGDTPGLTASVSPSGTYVLYSESTADGFTTKLFNTRTNATTAINLDVLPEKCTWLQNEDLICAGNNTVTPAVYPDAWYAGTVHFSDQLYHIFTASNTYTVLFDGQAQSFDMTNLQVDENQRFVYFIDKNTGFLWQFTY